MHHLAKHFLFPKEMLLDEANATNFSIKSFAIKQEDGALPTIQFTVVNRIALEYLGLGAEIKVNPENPSTVSFT
jgi:hypothetical protein